MELTKLLNTDARHGPPTQFHPWHILAAFYTFCQTTTPIGRYQLSSDLGLGGGSIRSLIRFLRSQGLIIPINRQGHQLSTKGKQHCEKLRETLIAFEELPESSYTIDVYNYGCHLHQLANYVTDGIEQRDAALQAGASGASTFIQDKDPAVLVMVKEHRIPKNELREVLEHFNIQVGDVLIIGSGSTRVAAQLGAFAATISLLKKQEL
ncbi:MAG: DUF4443 domain-containing protein [Promethearchaeota archaeon]